MKFALALIISKIVVIYTKIFGKGRGTNLPGAVALKIDKNFIKHIKGIDYDKVIFVTGTNGKSTSNNMIYHMFKESGKTIASNLEGANLIGGIATALIKNSNIFGNINTEYICFEVDERYFEHVYKYLPARNICVTNLQKDQVQRNGEPNYIYQKLKKVFPKNVRLFLNNDEPRTKSLDLCSDNCIYYGINENEKSYTKTDFYDVSMPCPKCHDKIAFEFYNVDNVGHFKCLGCDFKSEATPNYLVSKIDYKNKNLICNKYKYNISYMEPFFMYNYALCIAVGREFNLSEEDINNSFKTFKNIGGRLEDIKYKNKIIKYTRMKQENPETLQSAFNYVLSDKTPKIVILGLCQLEDFKPYYTNTFYTFDCDISDSSDTTYICFSKAISYDIANRLRYSGVPIDKIKVIASDDNKEFLRELDKIDCNNVYLITKLDKYNEIIKDIEGEKYEEN